MMLTESPPHHPEVEGERLRHHPNILSRSSNHQPNKTMTSVDLKLMLAQRYGTIDEADVTDADVICSLQFNDDGEFLAVGDKGGRITLYRQDTEYIKYLGKPGGNTYKFYHIFQSHEPEFDYLKSLEIEEKIVQIKWLPKTTLSHSFLSTNDKTVKLWKLDEKCDMVSSGINGGEAIATPRLCLPRLVRGTPKPVLTLRKVYANAHSYFINSISVNSDQQTFLTSDDLRINLWNYEVSDQCFNIVDMKPGSMEDLQEVITAAFYHPSSCNIFAYSSSKGATRFCDLRVNAVCDKHAKLFQEQEHPSKRGYFNEVVTSISDAQFSKSGQFLATRDYLNLKVWDTRMESKPVQVTPLYSYLTPRLELLYENDSIFDKFTLSWNGADSKLVTGTYHNMFSVVERHNNFCKASSFEVCPDFSNSKPLLLKPRRVISGPVMKPKKEDIPVETLDFEKKITYCQWHPKENIIAAASCNNLFLMHEKR